MTASLTIASSILANDNDDDNDNDDSSSSSSSSSSSRKQLCVSGGDEVRRKGGRSGLGVVQHTVPS